MGKIFAKYCKIILLLLVITSGIVLKNYLNNVYEEREIIRQEKLIKEQKERQLEEIRKFREEAENNAKNLKLGTKFVGSTDQDGK